MKVGLVRHFKVDLRHHRYRWTSSHEYHQWLQAYDTADIKPNQLLLNPEDWEICYCSDLYRAEKTARLIYSGPIIVTPLLREIQLHPVLQNNFRLPFGLWDVMGRIAWYNSRPSQVETRQQTMLRVREFISLLVQNPVNTLVVSHGGFMLFLRREMERQGFKGDQFTRARNGRLYLYEKS
jgi:broad specificity phosphatase PhoE